MKTIILLIGAWLFALTPMSGSSTNPSSLNDHLVKPDYEANIDWLWGNHDTPRKLRCLAWKVKGTTVRGTTTGHDCVVNSIKALRKDDADLALQWLIAGQCHNAGARKSISDAGQAAIMYAEQTYGDKVAE